MTSLREADSLESSGESPSTPPISSKTLISISGKLRPTILENLGEINWDEFPLAQHKVSVDDPNRFGPSSSKVLLAKGDLEKLDPNKTTWLGGICSLFTGDGELVRKKQITFQTENAFADWITSWYPRIDQVHDTIGIPPNSCKKAMYVVEDSIWARRIAKWTGLSPEPLSAILKEVHQKQGKPAIENWQRNMGFKGNVDIVYSSSIEKELELALRLLERQTYKIDKKHIDTAKVALMYSGAWLDILGLSTEGAIVEPMHHGWDISNPNPFSSKGIYQIGYLPYWGENGATRLKPNTEVVNRSNYMDTVTLDTWSAINFCFNTKAPLNFSPEQLQARIQNDLQNIYKI